MSDDLSPHSYFVGYFPLESNLEEKDEKNAVFITKESLAVDSSKWKIECGHFKMLLDKNKNLLNAIQIRDMDKDIVENSTMFNSIDEAHIFWREFLKEKIKSDLSEKMKQNGVVL